MPEATDRCLMYLAGRLHAAGRAELPAVEAQAEWRAFEPLIRAGLAEKTPDGAVRLSEEGNARLRGIALGSELTAGTPDLIRLTVGPVKWTP